ncbi:MAG TPA: glutaminyl-peptide cyclotransferase [Allosphingosinicella sp.]|jgi:glutamine cyclotransferase
MRSALAMFLGLAACSEAPAPSQAPAAAQPAAAAAPVQAVRVVRTYPHDPQAFTQGLIWLGGKLYESTGLVGQSTIREVDLETGRVLRSTDIPAGLFGEGITNWGDEILSITWQDNAGFRWDRRTFRQTGSWNYAHEGWGLTQDGRHVIMSDGSAVLRFLDPATMREVRRVSVSDAGLPVEKLNELEFVNGEIFANVWMTPRIARIDPASGRVTGWLDLTPIVEQTARGDGDNVLNGIAYDRAGDRLFVTGKNWAQLYEIDIEAAAPSRR